MRHYDDVIVAAINMGAHVDRVPAQELIDRFLRLLRDWAESVRSQLL
jgi:IclR family pca regulon transcriptional regulator